MALLRLAGTCTMNTIRLAGGHEGVSAAAAGGNVGDERNRWIRVSGRA